MQIVVPRNSGAGKESRTPDLNLGKVALYQLSYSREKPNCNPKNAGCANLSAEKRSVVNRQRPTTIAVAPR